MATLYTLERRSPKPEDTKPIFSNTGSEIVTVTSPVTIEQAPSPGIRRLLANNWEVNEVNVSGGYLVHFSEKEALLMRTWGVYHAINASARRIGGVLEEGTLYTLYDNGQVNDSNVRRKTGPQDIDDRAEEYLRSLDFGPRFNTEDRYGYYEKLAQSLPPGLFDFMRSKITSRQSIVYAKFRPRVKVTQTIEDGRPKQLVTLSYFDAKNFKTTYQ